MKIASFNVNSIRVRIPIILDWLETANPDILCIQETKVQDFQFPLEAFESTPYNCIYKGEKTYNGVAIFSKTPFDSYKTGFDSEPQDSSRIISAQTKGLTIVNTYIPQGYSIDSEKYIYKLEWFNRLLDFFQANFSPEDPIVWVGDFNVAPADIDVFNPQDKLQHVCFHQDVKDALQKVADWGFTDIFRKHCDQPDQYSFWDYRIKGNFKNNRGWRIDHIMATKPIAEKSTASYIDKEPRKLQRPSDHTPIIAEFDW